MIRALLLWLLRKTSSPREDYWKQRAEHAEAELRDYVEEPSGFLMSMGLDGEEALRVERLILQKREANERLCGHVDGTLNQIGREERL